MAESLVVLEERRQQLYEQLISIGDFRPGMISARYRKCGRGNCACAQPGHAGHGPHSRAAVKCRAGHAATFVDYRRKEITTVVGQVEFRRAYYHCGECGAGVLPQDEALDLVGRSFSPGVRRLMGGVGGKESFNEGRLDLEELAGIKVQTKAVERVAEGVGAALEALGQRERQW